MSLLNVKLGKFNNGRGLRAALRPSIELAIRKWSVQQVTRLKDAFDIGGHQSHGGSAWAPKKEGGRLLVGSGRLRNSIRYEANATSTTLIAAVPYASYIQEGSDDNPARPVIVVTKDDERDFAKTIKVQLNRDINGT